MCVRHMIGLDPYSWGSPPITYAAGYIAAVGIGIMDGAPMPLGWRSMRSLSLSLSMGVFEADFVCFLPSVDLQQSGQQRTYLLLGCDGYIVAVDYFTLYS